MNQQYTYISQVYDKMIEIDYSKWRSFIENYFKDKGIDLKGKEALELGCGTGNMTLELKKIGLSLTALDISQDMLNVAEEKLRLKNYKVNFINGDMTDISLGKKFNYIFSFCDGYNYLIEDGEILKAFTSAYNHLSENGYFIFDISTKYKLLEEIGEKSFTLNEEELCYIWDNYIDEDIIEMYITFFLKENDLYRKFEEVHYQKAYSVKYLVDILQSVGFKSVEIYNDYENTKLHDNSQRAVFIAKK